MASTPCKERSIVLTQPIAARSVAAVTQRDPIEGMVAGVDTGMSDDGGEATNVAIGNIAVVGHVAVVAKNAFCDLGARSDFAIGSELAVADLRRGMNKGRGSKPLAG